MSRPDIEVCIRVSSNIQSADEIESKLGWVADRKVSTVEARAFFNSSLSDTDGLEEHLEHLCLKLEQHAQVVISFSSAGDEVVIWCVIYSKGAFTGFALNSDLMRRLSQIDVDVVFSFYEGD